MGHSTSTYISKQSAGVHLGMVQSRWITHTSTDCHNNIKRHFILIIVITIWLDVTARHRVWITIAQVMRIEICGKLFIMAGNKTSPLWWGSIGHRWITLTKASDAGLWCFIWSAAKQTIKTPLISLTLSQCTLAGPVYTGMPLECHWLTQCTLGYHSKNLVETAPHWNATGET